MSNTNTSKKNELGSGLHSYLDTDSNWNPKKGNIHILLRKLKESKKKEIKEKLFFTVSVVSFLVISGIIISF